MTARLGNVRRAVGGFLDRHFGLIILLPTVVFILMTFVYPVTVNLWLSLTNKSLLGPSSYIGLRNYVEIFADPEFATSVVNTLVWTIGSVGLQFLVGLGFALLLYGEFRGARLFRVILLTPWTVPIIVLALIWQWMLGSLSGILPYTVWRMGLTSTMIAPLGMKSMVLPTLILIDVWRAFPLMMISLIAGLQTIPQEQLEVARLEGAGPFQTFRHVLWPNILRISGMLLALRTIWTFNTFDRLYLLTAGGPGSASETLPLYVYKKVWFSMQVGKGAAVSVIMVIILSLLTYVYIRRFRLLKGEQ